MPTTYSGDPTSYPTAITIPSDGDPKPAASILVAVEGIADRTANLAAPRFDATKTYGLASRTIKRKRSAFPVFVSPSDFAILVGTGYAGLVGTNVATLAYCFYPIDVPNGATILNVSLWVRAAPFGTYAAFPGVEPGTYPKIQLMQTNVETGTQTSLAASFDTLFSPHTVAGYQASHAIVISGTFGPIDTTTTKLSLLFSSEFGANAQAGMVLYGVETSYTVAEQDPGAF